MSAGLEGADGAGPRAARSQAIGHQLGRYGLVSLAALGLDVAVFGALVSGGMAAPVAGVIGYSAGLVLHFLLSCRVVFDRKAVAKSNPRLFGEFALSGLLGIATTWIVISLATGAGATPAIAKVLAVGVSFFLVFAVRRGIVFATAR